jgi:gluconolactonase
MKKTIVFFLGAACIIGLFSCANNVLRPNNENDNIGEVASLSASANGNCPSAPGSNFFDPNCLVSASQHGVLDTIQKGFSFTEGPAVDKHGNVFFTDQPNDKIYRWQASTGQITTFLTGTGRSNGMAFDKHGYLIACADMHGELWRIAPNGTHTVLVNNYNGKLLNGPNDVWINPVNGGIYITDPIFPRDYWDASDPRKQSWEPTHSEQAPTGKGGHVYYLAPGSNSLIRVTTMAGWNADTWPNGITGTPDGKKLYVNNWTYDGTGQIKVFNINPNGTLSNMQTLVNNLNFCDGMSLDEKGNIYVSGGAGLNAYDKYGNKVLTIPGGGGTNNVFAGANNKILFMTSPDRVTSVKMNVKGVEKF